MSKIAFVIVDDCVFLLFYGYKIIFYYYLPVCGYKCHKKCADNVPFNCGINQKMISEVLSDIKSSQRVRRRTSQAYRDLNFISKLEPKMDKLHHSMVNKSDLNDKEEKKTLATRLASKLHLSKLKRSNSFDSDEARKSSLSDSETSSLLLSDISILKQVGKGGYGKVFLVALAKQQEKSRTFAMKAIQKDSVLRDDLFYSIMNERDTLKLSHRSPFLAKLMATFQDNVKQFSSLFF